MSLELETELMVANALLKSKQSEIDTLTGVLERERRDRETLADVEARITARIDSAIGAIQMPAMPSMPSMPSNQSVDLSPVRADLLTLKSMIATLVMTMPKEPEPEYIIERHPIPPGSMLPYGPIKSVKLKGKA